jgi:hypothetical protein
MTRVMLEHRDYRQELVDLGCIPAAVGAVTRNAVTQLVDVEGSVWLHNNGLDRLPFAFGKVGGYFDCAHNRFMTLEGAPIEVDDDFMCNGIRLASLDEMPKIIHGDFMCLVTELLSDVSAVLDCQIDGSIYLYGTTDEQWRMKCMLHALQYNQMSKVVCTA